MLAALAPESLMRLRFPLGTLIKPEVRRPRGERWTPGRRQGRLPGPVLPRGHRPRPFLARHGGLGDRPGDVVDPAGRVLGRHRGQHQFTVGQRRGLGIAGAEPLYVLDKDAATRRVTVGPLAAL